MCLLATLATREVHFFYSELAASETITLHPPLLHFALSAPTMLTRPEHFWVVCLNSTSTDYLLYIVFVNIYINIHIVYSFGVSETPHHMLKWREVPSVSGLLVNGREDGAVTEARGGTISDSRGE